MELVGRRVLVTGASKGIGELVARRFAAHGARVALAARSGDVIERLADEFGGDAYPIDLADPAQVDGFIARVEDDGPLDILVNNAALEDFSLVGDLTSESIDGLLSLNLATPLKLTSQIVPRMIERGRGHVVQVSSMAAIMSTPGSTVYSATKAGLSHATACLELELQGTGVDLTTVHLGGVETDMGRRAVSAAPMAPLMKRFRYLGLDRLADPDRVAAGIVEAVVTGKRNVCLPANAMPMAGLANAPRRLMNLMARGITHH